ncbi:uncharacterized protein LOC132601285 [Lycium barbarum]|uniref:uncharacterized protein LOC132601285 n=1 Tax=Lycium barbarum TaxID=112863 RepID=UPI00293F52B1|nr:uncharacterized protein LOC132601285 [Lycium barbarum]XP_060170375.1 uncharacterized protein LOC132601285 [Lycium barbarum]XP_060170378.1 uncharacterized protein LOC132601285 [Lycium barbarum]
MHGRVQREEGQACKGKSGGGVGSQHMPATTTRRTVAVGDSIVSTVTADSFCKDGRKIRVGDCALFKPPHDSPPFIGIIRRLRFSKDNNLQLGLNWLYRPAEVKLSKGILLDTTPNEIFYSFHGDEAPAASLLHPCKVAFLPKGAELPTGISSFVCRRVYDISNKCLCWLTDQDYHKELQKEVDQLLYKTRLEMHATVHPGGRSPKPMNGNMASSQLKSGTDNVQSSVASFPSQVKGKKRERGEQGSESIKRERSVKSDDSESVLRSEISKITEEGGLVDCEGAAKLVQLMHPDRADRKMDLTSRSMLASVVAATEKFDCLARFVQLKGLPVLDGWLQDVHKGRIVQFSSSKDGDISIEEFLLVLLRALDKLPVNLQALQMCNIGKSVNHLRQHKNMEIQRKARSLVDTWKKRVEAEMNVIDAKSGSNQAVTWPSKSRLPEASHSGNKNPGGSSDATRSSVTQFSASKTTSVKPTPVETSLKSASSSPGPVKQASSPSSGKVGQPRVSAFGSSDVPLAREDKSSSSSQSHNHSQSFSGKEDARSSTAVSMSSIKISSGGSRHRKSINGGPGTSVSGGLKENSANRSSSLHRNPSTEKLLQSALSGEKTVDVPAVEGSCHKLIVKIPNKGRSPARSVSGGSYEEPTTILSSRASSPVLSEKNDQLDGNSKEKNDAYRSNVTFDVNAESWQSNVLKDVLTGSDEGDGSPVAVLEEERSKTAGEGRKSAEVAKPASSSSGTELKSGKLHEASFSSMNALIESCVKCSEANTSMSLNDAVGMNLLASVATEEMSKSERVSPSASPQGDSPSGRETCTGDELKSKSSPVDSSSGDLGGRNDGDANGDKEKQPISASTSWSEGKLHAYRSAVTEFTRDRRPSSSPSEETTTGECFNSSCTDSQTAGDLKSDVNEKLGEMAKSAAAPCGISEKASDGEQSKQLHEEKVVSTKRLDSLLDGELGGHGSSIAEDKVSNALVSIEDLKRPVEVSVSKFEGDNKNDVSRMLGVASTEVKLPSVVAKSESTERSDKEELLQTGPSRDSTAGKCGQSDEIDADNQSEKPNSDKKEVDTSAIEDKAISESNLARRNLLKDEVSAENNDISAHDSEVGLFIKKEAPVFSNAEVEKYVESREWVEADTTKDRASIKGDTSSSSAVAAPDSASKMKFDLNEGFISDEGKYGEPINSTGPGCLSNVHIMSPSTFAVSSVSSSLPASITVAAAAKGPFVPPEDLLRVKGEFGWKGSAATSAFRPAEPRKALDMHSSSTTISVSEASTSKHGRPPLDIDLNVADERIFEDINSQDCALAIGSAVDHITNLISSTNKSSGSPALRSSGGLDLDLNRVDEPNDVGQCSLSSSHRLEGGVFPSKASSSGGLPTVEVRRDFDLNNGPGVDDSTAEQPLFHQNHQGNMRSQLNASNLRMNNPEMGNLSSWFAPGNSYSTMTIPSILPDRVEQPPFPIISAGAPRMLGPSAAGSPFTADVFRGSVLSSSPAMPFPATPFQYPVFPFPTTFPLPSGTYAVGSTSYIDSSYGGRLFTSPMNSQFLGPVGAVSSQYPRPYVISLPDANSNGATDHNRKRSWQDLDLNAGPGAVDLEAKEESVSLVSRRLSVAGSQPLADEHGRMYPVSGSLLKRKEPEGGWDSESFRFKQSSWQ